MYKPPIEAWLHTLKAYERHISAVGMIGGFGFDFFAYGRVDHTVTQTLLIVYLGVAAASIALLHWFEAHEEWQSGFVVKMRAYLPALTQFVLGSLWSAFLVFYARSGVLAGSWPFLVILAVIFVGNEIFKQYHARLIFTTTLFFFALFSYCVFMLPVFLHNIGEAMFLLSGMVAVLLFAFFIWLLNRISMERLGPVRWQIAGGGLAIYALVTGLYFADVLPPLPLAMQDSGIYHAICRVPVHRATRCVGMPRNTQLAHTNHLYFQAAEEPQGWQRWLGRPAVIHLEAGKPVIFYAAVFAPTDLNTTAFQVWQHYDEAQGTWRQVLRKEHPLNGGREKGYRYFSYQSAPAEGRWRVDIETVDGRLIGRTEFRIEHSETPVRLRNVAL